MGEAINIIEREQTIHDCAYKPIHTYLAQIIPYLEYRQEVAKKLTTAYSQSDDVRNNYYEAIDNCNKHILKLLSITELNKEQ